jgi:hypothetical protein
MGKENIEEMGRAERGGDELLPHLESQAAEIRSSTAEDLLRSSAISYALAEQASAADAHPRKGPPRAGSFSLAA